LRISQGNTKLGATVNISLTPIASCNGCSSICGKDCYAIQPYKQYPQTRAAWDHNFKQATEDIEGFFNELKAYLEGYKRGLFFRWFVGGDIISPRFYINMCETALEHPTVKFLCFTKQYAIVNKVHNEPFNTLPENLVMMFSGWPGLPMDNPHNFPVAWMQDGTETRIPVDALECPGKCEACGACWYIKKFQRDVVFHKH
jgi:hypothetical protein